VDGDRVHRVGADGVDAGDGQDGERVDLRRPERGPDGWALQHEAPFTTAGLSSPASAPLQIDKPVAGASAPAGSAVRAGPGDRADPAGRADSIPRCCWTACSPSPSRR